MKKLLIGLVFLTSMSSSFAEDSALIVCSEGKSKSEAVYLLNARLKTYENAVMSINVEPGIRINRAKIKTISSVTFFKEDGFEKACVSLLGESI